MSSQVTIRAEVQEEIDADGYGYAFRVRVTGAEALSFECVREIAQEAVDSYYGQIEGVHRRVAVLGPGEWDRAREEGTRDDYLVRVHTY